ncbi:MAG TPA: hypothetical protein VFW89_06220 [Gemmatimonadaceae bacterium]|nr:hypothetical protein [Gemmatimonadaceae bacterium]
MSPRTPPPCTHLRGPGTTVCLHCRRDARRAAQARTAQVALRIGAGVVGVAVIAVLIRATLHAFPGDAHGTTSLVANGEAFDSSAAAPIAPVAEIANPRPHDGSPREPHASRGSVMPASATAGIPAGSASANLVSTAVDPSAPATRGAAALPLPALAEGRTNLGNGMFAMREGRVVTVHFDTPLGRTRKPDKFEATIRSTLPRVYGAVADSALARVPRGDIASLGNPATDLAATGIRLPAGNGVTLALWPETRPGQDGPLAVGYRAVAGSW